MKCIICGSTRVWNRGGLRGRRLGRSILGESLLVLLLWLTTDDEMIQVWNGQSDSQAHDDNGQQHPSTSVLLSPPIISSFPLSSVYLE